MEDLRKDINISENEIDMELINIDYERTTDNINQFKQLRNQYLGLTISMINDINTDSDIIENKYLKGLSDLIESLYLINKCISEDKRRLNMLLKLKQTNQV